MYGKILVAIDGSDLANMAFENALQLAKIHNAELLPLHVIEYPENYAPNVGHDPTPLYEALVDEGESLAARADIRLREEGVVGKSHVADSFLWGKTTAGQIQDAADAFQADLVIMGTHGRSGFKRLVLGSVAETFIRKSTRPVLLVPAKIIAEPTK